METIFCKFTREKLIFGTEIVNFKKRLAADSFSTVKLICIGKSIVMPICICLNILRLMTFYSQALLVIRKNASRMNRVPFLNLFQNSKSIQRAILRKLTKCICEFKITYHQIILIFMVFIDHYWAVLENASMHTKRDQD